MIHTVCPIWQRGENDEPVTLSNCYRNSLGLAAEVGATTIAFPSISTGVYGYPIDLAAPVALVAFQSALEEHDSIQQVTFVCFDDANFQTYRALLEC